MPQNSQLNQTRLQPEDHILVNDDFTSFYKEMRGLSFAKNIFPVKVIEEKQYNTLRELNYGTTCHKMVLTSRLTHKSILSNRTFFCYLPQLCFILGGKRKK